MEYHQNLLPQEKSYFKNTLLSAEDHVWVCDDVWGQRNTHVKIPRAVLSQLHPSLALRQPCPPLVTVTGEKAPALAISLGELDGMDAGELALPLA